MSEKTGELNWYVLRAVSGQERKIKTHLEKEIAIRKVSEYIDQVVTPTEKIYQMRKLKDGKTKKVQIEKTFFPGYVMVHANLSNGEILHMIKSVPGVLGFLNVDSKDPAALPKPMRESEINRILGKTEDGSEVIIRHESPFVLGEVVKITDGPFNTFDGTIEEIFEDKKKLNVMVKIFGRATPVELNYSQVAKIE